jgi:methylenetetrahydrofolate dehydrogenase (NADP+)/methenyltetrahydrofolate cyclohydrolase
MMTAKILDGKALAQQVKDAVKAAVAGMTAKPGLAVVMVGEDPGSKVYVAGKVKDAQEVGFHSFHHHLVADTAQERLMALVQQLAQDPRVQGILVQLPLPKQLDGEAVLLAIPPEKDVDGLHPYNLGRLASGRPCLPSCTPAGCMALIRSSGVEIAGKHAVVVGRSNMVGKPMAHMLLDANATVTICHSRTPDLAAMCLQADILVAAVGRPRLITGAMVKPGAVVIDVGMNRLEGGKLCGDVEAASVGAVAGFLTPVPGGVGPMTRAMLMQNTLQAARNQGLR